MYTEEGTALKQAGEAEIIWGMDGDKDTQVTASWSGSAGAALSRNDRKCLERQSSQTPALGFPSKRNTHPDAKAWLEPSLGNAERSCFSPKQAVKYTKNEEKTKAWICGLPPLPSS